jgi:hypothetical protein
MVLVRIAGIQRIAAPQQLGCIADVKKAGGCPAGHVPFSSRPITRNARIG